MSEQSHSELSPRQQFIQRAQAEMAIFELREKEFRKKDREQRAKELQMLLDVDVH